MTDAASLPAALRRVLAALPEAALTATMGVLPLCRSRNDQIDAAIDAWLLCEEGRDATAAARWISSRRMREIMDMRGAGRAASAGVEGGLPSGDDPLDILLAEEAVKNYSAALRHAGISACPAAPATIDTLPALNAEDVGRRKHRTARAIQYKMRAVCREEAAGQGALPGIPAAAEVYSARALGGAA